MVAERVQRLTEADEIAGDQLRALVNKLVKRVLSIRTGLAPVDGAGLIVHTRAVERDGLAVALHRQLLKVSGKPFEILIVRQHGHGLRAEEVVVPYAEQPHERR